MTYLYLAYYTGEGDYQDSLIRWATRSPFSHVELVFCENESARPQTFTALALSSSARDGGVREKQITFEPENWQFQRVRSWYEPEFIDSAKYHCGAKYDFKGLLLSQVIALNRHSRNRWFCSEFCAYALDLPHPQRFSPAGLFDTVSRLNRAFLDGRMFETRLRGRP